MSWQDQSLRQAFFALDPSRALKEFDSAIIYLAFYFRFIKKQIELWHEGQGLICQVNRDAGTGGAGGAAAPLAFCWEGQGGRKCPLSIKNIITVSFQGAFSY